jgi:hypothetical protein
MNPNPALMTKRYLQIKVNEELSMHSRKKIVIKNDGIFYLSQSQNG